MSDVSAISTSKPGISSLHALLRRAAVDTRRTNRRAEVYSLAWRWLAILAGLFVLDLVVTLPAWCRWIGLIGQATFLVYGIAAIVKSNRTAGSGDEWAARVIEARHPEIDNALIHAVQFERSRGALPPEQEALIERELTRAAAAASALPAREAAGSPGERAALKRMAGFLCAWAFVGLTFSGGFMAVMPRLFLPWLDEITPPYSPTHFDVRPQGATVRYDDSLGISVKTSGATPENMALMTKAGSGSWHRIALQSESGNLYSVKLDGLREETSYYVQGSTGRSALYHITVTRPPVVTGTLVTYTFPAYTRRNPLTQPLTAEGVHGLPGTQVKLTMTCNRVLKAGTIDIRNAEGKDNQMPVSVTSATPTQAIAAFTINRPGDYRVALTAEDEQNSPDAAHAKIKLDHDDRPTIWFTTPGQDMIVTADMNVPIHMKSADDVAVQRIEFHRHLNSDVDVVKVMPSAPPAAEVEQDQAIDLKACGAQAGDTIAYFATAFDNAPGTPNIGETEVYTLKVVTPEEFQKALLEQRQISDLAQESKDIGEALKSLAEQQKEVAKKLEDLAGKMKANPSDQALKARYSSAQQQQKDLQKQASDMAKQLDAYSKSPAATPLEKSIKSKIAQIAAQLGAVSAGSMSGAQSSNPTAASSAARKAAAQLGGLSREMEQQIQKALDNLAQVLPLFDDINRFKELLAEQRQLDQKAQSFKLAQSLSSDDKSRMDLLADTQSRISRALAKLQRDFIEHAAACEQNFPKAAASARAIAAEIDSREIISLMDSGRDKFRQLDGPAGYDSEHNALLQMEAMIQKCEGGQGQAGMQSELDISLKECLGQVGLGQSLSQYGMPSNSSGADSGGGVGGQNGAAHRGGKAYVPSVTSSAGTSGTKKMHHANHSEPVQDSLSVSQNERVKPVSQLPNKAAGYGPNGYPVEYRKMIQDYYKSVAEKQ